MLNCCTTERIRTAERYVLLVGFGSHQRSDGRRRLQGSRGAARERHRTVVLRGVSLLPSRQRHRTVGNAALFWLEKIAYECEAKNNDRAIGVIDTSQVYDKDFNNQRDFKKMVRATLVLRAAKSTVNV